jgi:hypothetical protein
MKAGVAVGALVLAACLAAARTHAHHSFAAEYDAAKPIVVEGVVKAMFWSNPHGHLYIDVKDPNGKLVTWNIEFASPNSLYRRGWKKTDLPVGTPVTVEGFLAKDGTPTASAVSVKLSDGRLLMAGSPR